MEKGHTGIKKACGMRKGNSKMENYMAYIIGTMIAGKNLNRKNFRMAYVMEKAFNGMKMAGNKLRESMSKVNALGSGFFIMQIDPWMLKNYLEKKSNFYQKTINNIKI